jgi:hypothetical protein
MVDGKKLDRFGEPIDPLDLLVLPDAAQHEAQDRRLTQQSD